MSFRQLKLTQFGMLEVIESDFAEGIPETVAAEHTAVATYDKATKIGPKIFKEKHCFCRWRERDQGSHRRDSTGSRHP